MTGLQKKYNVMQHRRKVHWSAALPLDPPADPAVPPEAPLAGASNRQVVFLRSLGVTDAIAPAKSARPGDWRWSARAMRGLLGRAACLRARLRLPKSLARKCQMPRRDALMAAEAT